MPTLKHFANAIEGRAQYSFTHDEIAHNIELLCAIGQSADDLAVVKTDRTASVSGIVNPRAEHNRRERPIRDF